MRKRSAKSSETRSSTEDEGGDRTVHVSRLSEGDILQSNVINNNGQVIAESGDKVTPDLIRRLKNFGIRGVEILD